MIQYLKDSDRVIKADSETQSLTVCVVKGDQMLIRHDVQNSTLYNSIINGSFVVATEQEYLDKKAEILSAI